MFSLNNTFPRQLTIQIPHSKRKASSDGALVGRGSGGLGSAKARGHRLKNCPALPPKLAQLLP